jgi:hypothetical protein
MVKVRSRSHQNREYENNCRIPGHENGFRPVPLSGGVIGVIENCFSQHLQYHHRE